MRRWPTWSKPLSREEAAMNVSSKITLAHRERLAVIYIRQSTIAQVRDHTESTARQYALAEEAGRL